MMRIAAVISEFNPFHNGHRFFIDSVRKKLGDDTCIIALMSGNYTQRGEVSIADKFTRAASAIHGGVDLVLEIPFPYSASSAEFFARAGVFIADALSIVDTLAFGSECGDLERLTQAAERLCSAEFKEALTVAVEKNPNIGHARITENVFRHLYGDDGGLLSRPNDILAIEYLRALLALDTKIKPLTVKRLCDYHAKTLADGISASSVRKALMDSDPAAYTAMPEGTRECIKNACEAAHAPATMSRLGPILLSYFRTVTPSEKDDLGHHLKNAAIRATDFDDFLSLTATKRYTHAHLRRAIWHRYFGVTSADLYEPPAFTQVLGMNERGRLALRQAARCKRIAILTKPADARALSGAAARQALLSQKADLIYPLAMPVPVPGNFFILSAPYRNI